MAHDAETLSVTRPSFNPQVITFKEAMLHKYQGQVQVLIAESHERSAFMAFLP